MMSMTCWGSDCSLLDLARISSNTSGFFLWGMMLEPVVHSLGRRTNEKFCELNRQASKAIFASVPAMVAMAKATLRSILPRPIWAYTTL